MQCVTRQWFVPNDVACDWEQHQRAEQCVVSTLAQICRSCMTGCMQSCVTVGNK